MAFAPQLRLLLSLSLSLALFATSASAAIIDTGATATDTATNLEWLDLTETLGLTWNQVEASSVVTVDGFTHATAAQVDTLFLNAGFLTTNNVNDPLNDPAATLLLDALGCTQFCGTVNATGRGFADNGDPWTTRPNYHTSGLGSGAAIISLQTTNKDLADATAGHFMVRVVPEPSTAILMLGGLACLSARRRQTLR